MFPLENLARKRVNIHTKICERAVYIMTPPKIICSDLNNMEVCQIDKPCWWIPLSSVYKPTVEIGQYYLFIYLYMHIYIYMLIKT